MLKPAGVPVVLVDEGRSSQAAAEMLEGHSGRGYRDSSQAIDAVAACVILERYYESPGTAVRVKVSTYHPMAGGAGAARGLGGGGGSFGARGGGGGKSGGPARI